MNVPRYTLRQLAYLVAVARAGSIAAASRSQHVSRSSISSALAELERVFGAPLFAAERGAGISLTPLGRTVLERATGLLAEAGDLQTLADPTELSGTVRVGAFPSVVPTVFPTLYRHLQDEHPLLNLEVTARSQPELLRLLRDGDVDMIVAYNLHLEPDLAGWELYSTRMHLIVPHGHPLADSSTVAARDAARFPLILMSLSPGHDDVLNYFLRLGLQPRVAIRTDHFELMRSLVGRGLGVALSIQSPFTPLTYEGNRLQQRPLTPTPHPEVLSVLWPRTRQLSRAALSIARWLASNGEHLRPTLATDGEIE